MKVEKVKLSDIELHPDNYKTVTKDAFERVKYQLKTLPQYKPIVADKRTGYILGGNTRYRAAQQMGWNELWVSWVETETDKEAFEIMVSDNDEAGKADEMLVQEQAIKFEIDASQFGVNIQDQTLVADLIQDISPEPEEDEAPEVKDDAVSELGKIYQLGEHRVMCGDSTKEADVALLMNGEKADCVHTDPPYGLGKKMSGGTWATKASHYKDMHEWDKEAEQAFF